MDAREKNQQKREYSHQRARHLCVSLPGEIKEIEFLVNCVYSLVKITNTNESVWKSNITRKIGSTIMREAFRLTLSRVIRHKENETKT